MSSLTLSPKQTTSIAECTYYRVSLWYGAVSAGKTLASLIAFVIAVRNAPAEGEIVIVGKTLQTIERNVISQLRTSKLFGSIADQVSHTDGSSTAIILGRKVSLVGANNKLAEERIRGGTFSLVYVDEATLVPELFWNMLYTRLRVSSFGRIVSRMLATTNPGSKNHWLNKKWIQRGGEVQMRSFHFRMTDNPDLAPEYITSQIAAFKSQGKAFYERFILGNWTTAEGAVYADWDPEAGGESIIQFEDMPQIRRVLSISLDFGTTNPTVALMLGITDERRAGTYDLAPRLILMDEWVDDPALTKRNHAPSEQARMFREWKDETHIPAGVMVTDPTRPFVIVDPAAKAFREELRALVPSVPTTPADNAVLNGIGTVASLIAMKHPNGGRLLQATDRCERWADEITEYIWDAKKQAEGIDEVVKLNDHAMDAGRYGVRTTRQLWVKAFREAYGLAA